MAKINMKENPFFLDEEAQEWVLDTWKKMSLEQKCGQVFCPMGLGNDPELLKHLTQDIGVGGLMYRADTTKNIQQTHRMLQEFSDIPLLLAANTEAGGDGLALEGTSFGKPMAVAATNNPENGYRMGLTACKEGAALGLNWSFAPIVDINYDFHNPITNVRTFGSDPEKVLAFASRYLDAADECDVAVAIKHFPGDGVDERDQHILTSVNSFSTEKWDETFGYVYSNLIQKGAKTVMVGHIAQPAYVKAINPNATRKEMLRPASLSPELLTGLLRGKLGFNGLISTDATPMVGFTAAMKRCEAIPQAIAAGCDMILFNKSLEEDYGYLLTAVKEGKVSEERLDEAVLRILATKASLHLHEKKRTKTLVPGEEAIKIVGCQTHKTWAKEVADQAITLVRDNQNLLPISPKKYKRVYLNVIEGEVNDNSSFAQDMKKRLEQEGFEVTLRIRAMDIDPAEMFSKEPSPEFLRVMGEINSDTETFVKQYDLCILVLNIETISNATVVRINWKVLAGLGNDFPWYCGEIPLVTVSFANPYHLLDAPMSHVYVNAYSNNPETRAAVIEKLLGKSEFKGESPIDPFCGHEDCRL